MAKKTKTGKTPETKPDDTVKDAVDAPEESAPEQEGAFILVEPVEEAEAADAPEEETVAEDEPAAQPEPEPDAEHESEPLVPVAPPASVVVKKGGFIPMLLGGIVAAIIGFGVARFVLPDGWPWPGQQSERDAAIDAQLDAQKTTLADMQATLQNQKIPDIAPLEKQIGSLQADVTALSGKLDSTAQTLDSLDKRMTTLEAKPVTSAADPDAVAAYERELKQLQDAMASQRAQVENIAAQAKAKEAAAETAAREATVRAALSRVEAALDAGDGFADAAAQLNKAGVTLPPELAGAAKAGVPSRAALLEDFAPAARATLRKARGEETGGGFTAFLKDQLGARSLKPREGSDPDAVLSRAEAAVKEGRIADALAGLDALPADAKAAMAEWMAKAKTRMDAMAAVKKLSGELNGNRG
jgi:hypothetical protein